ncbi:MAG TPA: peptide MFS transporter [Candidatus Acidoferrales bacterium]|jgi:POT family proton-dependent oligopeptide transporter|nr:peptide MFS transporter [Candidatus Acidoferrales bacterium]
MAPIPDNDTRFFGHPRGLATLFFTEMWERFSYYGMRAILILFLTHKIAEGGLGFSDSKAGAVYSLYTAMVYLLCLGGGWVADRITGQRRAVFIGGACIAAGEFCLVVPSEVSFYLGLVLLMIGTGMLKGNVSTIVGQLYKLGDLRRDSGFSLFYMGINTGALVSPFICGYVGERISWRLGFGVAGLGMLVGLIQFVLGSKHLGNAGLHPHSTGNAELDRKQKRNAAMAVGGGLGAFAILGVLGAAGVIEFTPTGISDGLGWVLLGISVAVFSWMIFSHGWSPEERKRSSAILVLFVASALFWASFEQAGSSLSLFADRDTNRNLPYGLVFPASWFQFVQPIFVVALSPVFAWIWLTLARRRKEPPSPAKFTLGLVFGGLAFAILVPATIMVSHGFQVSMWWLVGTYFLQTLGELLLSPVGLSAMSKLAPARAGGFVMGIWFLSTSIGNWLAGRAGGLYSTIPLPTLFGWVAGLTFAAALVMALMIKPTVRLMSGVK